MAQKNAPQQPRECDIDEALRESFPASDPPCWSPGEIKKIDSH